jgi:SIR2-like domain
LHDDAGDLNIVHNGTQMRESKGHRGTNFVQELAYHFRSNKSTQPVLLLGAGASYRSGVPLADEAVKRIARASYAWRVLGRDEDQCNPLPSDWMPYLEQQEWFIADPERFAENFPIAVTHLLRPQKRRRKFLQSITEAPNGLSEGYRALGRLMLRRLCWTVLTTNFDRLLHEALHERSPHVRDIVEVNKTNDDVVRFSAFNRFQVVYLHGAVEFYRDRNDQQETNRLDDAFVRLLRPLLRDSPLIVVGYRGAEPSVMQHLLADGVEECQRFRNGIYWCRCVGSTLHPNVLRLQEKIGANFHEVEIEGFDEMMQALDAELLNDFCHSGEQIEITQGPLRHGGQLDHELMDELTSEDLDKSLLLSTLRDYCRELHLGELNQDNLEQFVVELGLLVRRKGALIPTKGSYLLFGIDVAKYFPYAHVILTISKRRRVFEGNLLNQYRNLMDYLGDAEINPVLRIKGESGSHESTAYPPRALRELCVNLLMHRDYAKAESAHIDFEPGRRLIFTNPGGLVAGVIDKLPVSPEGRFTPVRGVTGLRNSILADIFYGLGRMDKAGSGLVDVRKWMTAQGGLSEFSVVGDNTHVSVTLNQPVQEQPETSPVAVSLLKTEVFITNLLPFLMIPREVFFIPLKYKRSAQRPISIDLLQRLPKFVYHADHLVTFAPADYFEDYPQGELLLERTSSMATKELTQDENRKRVFVWLLHRHLGAFLRNFSDDGLFIENRQKRAFFCLRSGTRNVIPYVSRLGRRIRRSVVKQRGALDRIWYENEGIYYSAVSYKGEWVFQLKPMYVFTGPDGRKPLPPMAQTRRATRRFKFDRNKSVDDDLTFWARYLSKGESVINLGGLGVDDLVLNGNYCQVEIPVVDESVP